MLAPILDFEKHSATEQYVETLPSPSRRRLREKRAIVGMDRDQVIMAMGRPVRKSRDEGRDDYEDWIYGQPPGSITFVTFQGSKVVKVKDAYAGLGGSTAPELPPPHKLTEETRRPRPCSPRVRGFRFATRLLADFNFDLARLCDLLLREFHRQHAILIVGLHTLGVYRVGQREIAGKSAISALNAVRSAFFGFVLDISARRAG